MLRDNMQPNADACKSNLIVLNKNYSYKI